MVPGEGEPKSFELKSSWHQRRWSKILPVSLKHLKEWGGGGGSRGVPPLLLLRCTAVLIHHWEQGMRVAESNCGQLTVEKRLLKSISC